MSARDPRDLNPPRYINDITVAMGTVTSLSTVGTALTLTPSTITSTGTVELETLAPDPSGTYGDATNVSQLTVDVHGRVTGAVDVPITSSALTVQDEGISLATGATTLNFTGAGVTASGTGATKTIDIAAAVSTHPGAGTGSILLGTGSAGGFGAIRVGNLNNALGDYSTAIGYSVGVNGVNGSAYGVSANCTGARSVALGYSANAFADDSVAINDAQCQGARSIAIGKDAATAAADVIALGAATANAWVVDTSGPMAITASVDMVSAATPAIPANATAVWRVRLNGTNYTIPLMPDQ